MIRRLGSNLASFKPLEFKPGLNILLADKSEGATNLHSRNGAGKTSLIELVHFLFGAEVRKESIFRSEALKTWDFDAHVDIQGDSVWVSRSGAERDIITIMGPVEDWPIQSRHNQITDLFENLDNGKNSVEKTNDEWKTFLGSAWFGLPNMSDGKGERNNPSFRRIFPYFARRQVDGGFQNPTQYSTKQPKWSEQVSLSYLLGLDWNISRGFESLRNRESTVREMRKASNSPDFNKIFGKSEDTLTRLVVAENRYELLREQIKAFEIIPQYKDLEREANEITAEVNSLNGENVIDARFVKQLEESLNDEGVADFEVVKKLYSEAKLTMPEKVWRRFDEVEMFHRAVMKNRRAHLAAEINSAKDRLSERDKRVSELDRRRRKIMKTLETGGALDHYNALREEAGRVETEVAELRQRVETAKQVEKTKEEVSIERSRLITALRDDIYERGDIIREAILAFESLSESLYENAGSLTVSATRSGPKFEVHIGRQRSKGISRMQIFCFDLMLTEISLKRGRGPGFLIHDSHLFDGVDERQVAKALQLGSERAEANGYQYIVTMNSDALPSEGFGRGFDVRDHVMDIELTDETDKGGLFGLRFE